MNLKLQTTNYKKYLKSNIDSLVIGLKDFCLVEKGAISFKNIDKVLNKCKNHNKKLYIRIDKLLHRKDLEKFKNIFNKLVNKNIEGFYISDYGVLNMFIEKKLEKKVIFSASSYITNSGSINELKKMNINKVLISNELKKEDIYKIKKDFNNFIEVFVYGNFFISFSKRKILSFFLKINKIKKKYDHYYLKEEKRSYKLPLIEDESGLFIFNKEIKNILDIIDKKGSYLLSDLFLKKKEIENIIYNIKEGNANEKN